MKDSWCKLKYTVAVDCWCCSGTADRQPTDSLLPCVFHSEQDDARDRTNSER